MKGEETGEGTGICPRAVLCVACVRVLNGSFSASFLVKGVRTDVLVVVVVVVVVETQKMRCWVSVKKEKEWRLGEVAAGASLKTRIEFALAVREGGKPI